MPFETLTELIRFPFIMLKVKILFLWLYNTFNTYTASFMSIQSYYSAFQRDSFHQQHCTANQMCVRADCMPHLQNLSCMAGNLSIYLSLSFLCKEMFLLLQFLLNSGTGVFMKTAQKYVLANFKLIIQPIPRNLVLTPS